MPITITRTPAGQAINLHDQRDCELMQQALQRALNTWDGPPDDLLRVYDQLKEVNP